MQATPNGAPEGWRYAKMKKGSLLTLGAILFLVVLYGLLTGGMTYGVNQWFGGQDSIRLDDGTEVGLWLQPTHRQWDVPFLAHYMGSTPPYTLQIWFPAPDPAWESAEINEVLVEYGDGTRDRRTGGAVVWRRADGEMTLWSGPLKNLVARHESCDITVTGRILAANDEATSFSFSHRFTAEREEAGIASYWWALGQQG